MLYLIKQFQKQSVHLFPQFFEAWFGKFICVIFSSGNILFKEANIIDK